jgi:hypothetical protein
VLVEEIAGDNDAIRFIRQTLKEAEVRRGIMALHVRGRVSPRIQGYEEHIHGVAAVLPGEMPEANGDGAEILRAAALAL